MVQQNESRRSCEKGTPSILDPWAGPFIFSLIFWTCEALSKFQIKCRLDKRFKVAFEMQAVEPKINIAHSIDGELFSDKK